MTRSLTGTFKAARDRRIDYFVVETNKLLIRLDKLISPDAPTDTGKRKGNRRHRNHLVVFYSIMIGTNKAVARVRLNINCCLPSKVHTINMR